jgi:2-haloacid dehalogenase
MTNEPTEHAPLSADRPITSDRPRRPAVLIFDVNETLSDMSPMAQRFEDVGAPSHLATTWFAGLLRDGFALTAVGTSAPFARIAAEALRISLHDVPLNRATDDAVQHIMEGFAGLSVHADVPDAISALHGMGVRLVTLSNGSTSVAEALFDRAEIRSHFEALLSVENAEAWKPAAGSYAYALEQCEIDAKDAMLVAVHPWDIVGAAYAGLATAWINRTGGPYPAYFTAPDLSVRSLTDLTDELS